MEPCKSCTPRRLTVIHMNRRVVLRVVALLGCLSVGLLACSRDPEATKQKHLSRGQKYLSEQKVDEAIIEFKSALQVDPKFAEAHNQLGRAYQQKSWAFDARWEFQKAIEVKPDLVEAHVNLG